MPDSKEEKKLRKRGYKRVAGLDEAGRGSLAGPVVAGAVCFSVKALSTLKNILKEINDSKKLSQKKRERLFEVLTTRPQIKWGTGKVSEKVIDKINILEAAKLAMKRAVKNLIKKSSKVKSQKIDFFLVDGNSKINTPIPQKAIIKADEKVVSCAAASIIAKVTRDRIMRRYHKKYPRYAFDRHKGYPTKYHLKMLKKYGSCKIHRKTFKPVLKTFR